MTGIFLDTETFGADEASETDLASAGYSDIFVAKYQLNRKKRAATE